MNRLNHIPRLQLIKTTGRLDKYEPDECYFIGDNVEAIRLITDLPNYNVLHLMKPINTANESHHCFPSKDHWCMASHYIGHEDENENGYSMVMVPKSKMTKEQAAHFFSGITHQNAESTYVAFHKKENKDRN